MQIINDTFNCGVRTIIAKPEGVCSQAIELKLFGDEIASFYKENLLGLLLCELYPVLLPIEVLKSHYITLTDSIRKIKFKQP